MFVKVFYSPSFRCFFSTLATLWFLMSSLIALLLKPRWLAFFLLWLGKKMHSECNLSRNVCASAQAALFLHITFNSKIDLRSLHVAAHKLYTLTLECNKIGIDNHKKTHTPQSSSSLKWRCELMHLNHIIAVIYFIRICARLIFWSCAGLLSGHLWYFGLCTDGTRFLSAFISKTGNHRSAGALLYTSPISFSLSLSISLARSLSPTLSSLLLLPTPLHFCPIPIRKSKCSYLCPSYCLCSSFVRSPDLVLTSIGIQHILAYCIRHLWFTRNFWCDIKRYNRFFTTP